MCEKHHVTLKGHYHSDIFKYYFVSGMFCRSYSVENSISVNDYASPLLNCWAFQSSDIRRI